ncbi:MAG: hypothetical protein LBH57_10090 [Treponema sp.]|jgi:hypothetical protein|nr:hypothetical protein [Treponema sp.]
MKNNDRDFPVFNYVGSGMTLRQYAAIHLRVPRSGNAEIDAMIRESRRMEFAGLALARPSVILPEAEWCLEMADAMIAELEKEAGK